jgi:hypothetical protein
MNAAERWSCYVSIPKLAQEADCSDKTCWRAIHDAEGVHILSKRGTLSTAHGRHDVTFITIRPRYKLANLKLSTTQKEAKLSNLNEQAFKSAKTSFQKCEENFLIRTPIKELSSEMENNPKTSEKRETQSAH